MIKINSTIASSFPSEKKHGAHKGAKDSKGFLQSVAENDYSQHDQASKNNVKKLLETDYLMNVEDAENAEQEFVSNVLQNTAVPDDGIAPLLARYTTEEAHNFTNQLSSAHKNPLTEVDIEKLINLIPQSKINMVEISSLVQQIIASEPGNEMAMIDQFLKTFTNYAEIYLILELLLAVLKKSGKKGCIA